ncbi:WD40-repeat-containing domain protein [Butyriboletus roseoflavus]|nr:WD40-repeat-containing domain protein [Butyriboletus roseoflavus]
MPSVTLLINSSRPSAPRISLTGVAIRQTSTNRSASSFINESVYRTPTYHAIGLSSSASHLDKSDTPSKELASRRALNDARPTKKRATDAMKMAADAVKNHNELKRKERRTPEVIEISSDSEPDVWPSKRHKVDGHAGSPYLTCGRSAGNIPKLEAESFRAELHSPSPSDWGHSDGDDDDCINLLASLDISNEANWVPLPERNKAEDLTPMHPSDSNLSKPQPLPPFRLPRQKPPVDYRHLPFEWASAGPWGTVSRNYGITRFPKPFYHARRHERLSPPRPPNLYHEKGYTKLELTSKYPHLASGCKCCTVINLGCPANLGHIAVNKIVQKQGSVVLCAVAEGGLDESDDDDDDERPPPPENRPGSLVVYHRGQVHVVPAHCHPCTTSRGSVMKYYVVLDVAFNPSNPRQFLSSGCDLAVKMWEIPDHDDNDERRGLGAMRSSESTKHDDHARSYSDTVTFDSRPQDLLYAPDGLTLAITCRNGTVRLYSQDLFEDMIDAVSCKKLCVAPKGSDHAAGSTLWGDGPSKHLLFSSSEPKENDHSGFHHAFDTRRGVQVLQFDATESGDAAALSPDGATLVLFTCGKDNTHPVRLYDVRRKLKEAYETEKLEKFHVRSHTGSNQELGDLEEVNQASFSPDGRLLAVARNDNALHVYDIRALSRGPLCRFQHHDSDTVGGGEFGIVEAKWIQGRDRIGIVSGGNDGGSPIQ